MAGSQAFEWLCEAIEADTSLGRLEARGTVRLALKDAGLEAGSVTPAELRVVVQKILPRELRQRGVANDTVLCERYCQGLGSLDVGSARPAADSPDAIFRRLGGSL